MWFTPLELKQIDADEKILTIRRFRKNNTMPIKVGSTTYLKTGSMVSKERYGEIGILEADVKKLRDMTYEDAHRAGYKKPEEYIHDQQTQYNKDINLDETVIFYTFKKLWTDTEKIKALQ